MSKLQLSFFLWMSVLFVSSVNAQTVTVSGSDVEAKTYKYWLSCGSEKIAAEEKPSFIEGDYTGYLSAFDDLIVKKKDDQDFCRKIKFAGRGWDLHGFVYGLNHTLGNKVLLLKMTSKDEEKYVDVLGGVGKLFFRISEDNEDLVVTERAPEFPGEKVAVINQLTGRISKKTESGNYLIMDKNSWTSIWKEHSDKPTPDVNFKKHMVVAIFLGTTYNRVSVNVADLRDTGDMLNFRYSIAGLQSFQPTKTVPFGIFVIPKTDKPVQFIERKQRFIGGPVSWELKEVLLRTFSN